MSVSGEETGLRISNYGRRVVICSLAAVALLAAACGGDGTPMGLT